MYHWRKLTEEEIGTADMALLFLRNRLKQHNSPDSPTVLAELDKIDNALAALRHEPRYYDLDIEQYGIMVQQERNRLKEENRELQKKLDYFREKHGLENFSLLDLENEILRRRTGEKEEKKERNLVKRDDS